MEEIRRKQYNFFTFQSSEETLYFFNHMCILTGVYTNSHFMDGFLLSLRVHRNSLADKSIIALPKMKFIVGIKRQQQLFLHTF